MKACTNYFKKMSLIISLVVLFIMKIRFLPGKSIACIITKRYGRQHLNLFRNCEKTDYKLRKTKCDLEFLETCYNNGLLPKFLNFRLYTTRYSSSHLYREFQRKLLEKEIKFKKSQVRILQNKKDHLYNQLKDSSLLIDLPYFHGFISKANVFKISSVQLTHSKKLFNLGLRCQFEKLSPDKIIFNYSNRILTPEEKEALSHGLKYGLIPPKINYSKFFLSFEKFFYNIKQEQIYDISGDYNGEYWKLLKHFDGY